MPLRHSKAHPAPRACGVGLWRRNVSPSAGRVIDSRWFAEDSCRLKTVERYLVHTSIEVDHKILGEAAKHLEWASVCRLQWSTMCILAYKHMGAIIQLRRDEHLLSYGRSGKGESDCMEWRRRHTKSVGLADGCGLECASSWPGSCRVVPYTSSATEQETSALMQGRSPKSTIGK